VAVPVAPGAPLSGRGSGPSRRDANSLKQFSPRFCPGTKTARTQSGRRETRRGEDDRRPDGRNAIKAILGVSSLPASQLARPSDSDRQRP
jgi:hypothetical protein